MNLLGDLFKKPVEGEVDIEMTEEEEDDEAKGTASFNANDVTYS